MVACEGATLNVYPPLDRFTVLYLGCVSSRSIGSTTSHYMVGTRGFEPQYLLERLAKPIPGPAHHRRGRPLVSGSPSPQRYPLFGGAGLSRTGTTFRYRIYSPGDSPMNSRSKNGATPGIRTHTQMNLNHLAMPIRVHPYWPFCLPYVAV